MSIARATIPHPQSRLGVRVTTNSLLTSDSGFAISRRSWLPTTIVLGWQRRGGASESGSLLTQLHDQPLFFYNTIPTWQPTFQLSLLSAVLQPIFSIFIQDSLLGQNAFEILVFEVHVDLDSA